MVRSAGPLRSAGAFGEAFVPSDFTPAHRAAGLAAGGGAGAAVCHPMRMLGGPLPHTGGVQRAPHQPSVFLFFCSPEKLKDSVLPTPKPLQHPLHPPPSSHHPVPSLIPNHNVFPLPGSSAATALLIHRTNEEEKWLARQRRLRQEKEDRQSQVSEFRQQVLEQHLDMGRTPSQPEPEHRPDNAR